MTGLPKQVAVIGVSHWHSTYDASYLALLRDLGVPIVGVSDPDEAIAADRARRFGTTPFADAATMLARTEPDFVFALGRHADMPATFRQLVAYGLPFIMEKPWGVDDATVRELADLAERSRTWVCVPFMTRYTHWAEAARAMVAAGELGRVSHAVFRMIRPTIERYVAWDSPWMLRRAEAGGGALLNLGSHGFDMCSFITGEEPEVVSAVLGEAEAGADVENYAHVTLRTPSGIIFHNEVGYTMPTWPRNETDGERKVAGSRAILRAVDGGIHLLGVDRNERVETPAGTVQGYKALLADAFARLADGRPPPVTARDCARAVTLIHDAYRTAAAPREGR